MKRSPLRIRNSNIMSGDTYIFQWDRQAASIGFLPEGIYGRCNLRLSFHPVTATSMRKTAQAASYGSARSLTRSMPSGLPGSKSIRDETPLRPRCSLIGTRRFSDVDVERARLLHQYALHRAGADAS